MAGSQDVDAQGVAESQISSCPQSCPNCRQAKSIADNSGHDAGEPLQSLVTALQNGDDGIAESRGAAKGNGKSLLEAIRLLAEMDPDERTALVGLLKAFG